MKKMLCALMCLLFAVAALPVAASAEGEKIKVACVGDSITEGWASTNVDTQCYPAHLQNLLGDGYDVKNFSMGGRTAMKVAEGYTPIWNEGFFVQSKSFEPDIVILMLGTNDVMTGNWNDGETYYPDLKALVETYQGLSSSPTVYLATPSTAFDSDHPDKLQNKAVPIVKQVAQETGATLVDINALTANNGKYYPDGIHPNDEGYYRLALMFYEHVFDRPVYDLTVTAEPDATVRIGELSALADSQGKAVIPSVGGDVSFLVSKTGGGFVRKSVTVTADTEVGCTNIIFPENLALNATVTDSAGKVALATDGNASTGWQSSNGDYSNLFLSFDLGSAKDVNAVDMLWEESTRARKGSYVIEYSADGSQWTEISNPVYKYSGAYDAVIFDSVSAQYVRIRISDGVSGKNRPKLFEMGVYTVAEETAATLSETVSSESAGEDGNNNELITYILMGVIAVAIAGIAAAFTVKKQKKDNSNRNVIQ